MNIYEFKVWDYTTILVGRMRYNENRDMVFYIERGDGIKYEYDKYRVEWYKQII